MQLKSGVKLTNLCPQMTLAAYVVKEVFTLYGCPCVITSGNDSVHSETSLHFCKRGKYTDGVCRALDFRTKYLQLNGLELELTAKVKERLGPDFDVVLEYIGTENEHLHVEYDPKEVR
jgi:hypothetical protein